MSWCMVKYLYDFIPRATKQSSVKQILIKNILTQMRCTSVTLDQRDGPRKFYHRGLRLEVSDTGYSHELCLGPPFFKEKLQTCTTCNTVKKQNSIFQTHYNSIHNKLEGQVIHTRL
jgi:hypothetical protein